MSEMRWHPLLGQWVIVATHRMTRTYRPPANFCPLCPTRPGGEPTEVPAADYDIVVFENKFPSLAHPPPLPDVESLPPYAVAPAQGICEVVLYCPRHDGTLTDEPVAQIAKLVRVWTHRYEELGRQDFIKYVFIFENKGAVIGVTLDHPHGQIYGFPFIPPMLEAELAQCRAHTEKTGRCLVCDIVEHELAARTRILFASESFVAFVPFYARYPYEVHIASRRHLGALTDLTTQEQWDLARILKGVLLKYDNLFGFSFPYMMVLHQRPTDGDAHKSYHFHIEFYPPHRTVDKLKYAAGCESGAGTFINDSAPEDKAQELAAVPPQELPR